MKIFYENQYFKTEIKEDVEAIDLGPSSAERSSIAWEMREVDLWPEGVPEFVKMAWEPLKSRLLLEDEDWDVWTTWYDKVLLGDSSYADRFGDALGELSANLWWGGEPRAVNARIKELIGEDTPPEPIPAQGPGPHFALNQQNRIELAVPAELDATGNDVGRLRQQLPLVREAADDFAGRLNLNAFPELARTISAYRAAIDGEPETIAWGVVFARGVRLENAATAARRQIEDRLQPPLEDAAQEALDSVLTLHGPMILATIGGRELMNDADRMRLTRAELAALRSDAIAIAKALNDDKEVIEPLAAEVVVEAAETIGQDPHPERGSAIGGATIRNVTIWVVGIGAIAAITGVGLVQAGAALLAIEGLKKSKRFSAVTDALGTQIDGVLRTGTAFQNFVLRNEQPLRQIASRSAGMRWMLPYIDEVVRRKAGEPPSQ